MPRIICFLLFLILNLDSYSWNAVGHELVAQIAYDNLTPTAKRMSHKYLCAYKKLSAAPDFIRSSIWLDLLKKKGIHRYDLLHYIDIPFSQDNTSLPALAKPNALSAIEQAIDVLTSNKFNNAKKGFSLRILIHLIGDIHQPLHTVTKISRELPEGDLGGNLFKLGNNPIGENLHNYWDNGAGFLMSHGTKFQIKRKAHQLEKKWSCTKANQKKNPEEWIDDSHQLAITEVYTLHPYQVPSKHYNSNARHIVEKQILFAGCRLAYLINKITAIPPLKNP